MRYLLLAVIFLCCCKQKQNTSSVTTQDSLTRDSLLQDSSKLIPSTVSTDAGLITDSSFGSIKRTTAYTDLQKMFGNANLLDTIDYAPEGLDSFIVTMVYPNTPKELIVGWQKGKRHKAVSTVECLQENAPYHTPEGLHVGSTLDDLVKINGKKINFYGTGWDYGGIITSYNKGKLENSKIFFILNSREDAVDVMGDSEINTDMAKVKANLKKLFIARISVSLQ